MSSTSNGFQIASIHEPAGDQPKAINDLSAALSQGDTDQVLLGATGSIGQSALNVLRQNSDSFNLLGIAFNNNFDLKGCSH